MTSIQEQNILAGIVAGDTAIIKEFYQRNWIMIRNYIIKNGGTEQEAEDIFQDALVCLYRKGITNALTMHIASIHTYFYAICKNMWLSHLRNRAAFDSARKQWELEHTTNDTHYLQEQEWNEERRGVLQSHLEQLSKTGKELMELVATGLSMEDIARRMGYTEGYTRKKKFDTKKALLEKLYKDHRYWELTG